VQPLFVGFDLVHEFQCNFLREVAQLWFVRNFVSDNDPKEDRAIPRPIRAEVVADSHNSNRSESPGGALNDVIWPEMGLRTTSAGSILREAIS